MEPLLYISNLEKHIMDDFHLGPINLHLEPGTITALIGNNGSGKSTLLKTIMNLVKPDHGNIKIDNKFVHGENESWKPLVAYQPQTIIGWNAFTGEILKRLIAPLYPNWDERLFQKMIELFDVPLHKKFSKLSQGVQQKLNLALTVPRNAPLLILDEPTSFMDIPSKKLLIDLLVDWMEPGNRSILIASHQIDDIKKLSDYLFVLHNGKMLGHFEKEELTSTYARFWLNDSLSDTSIPGEVSREDRMIISDNPAETEAFLEAMSIKWSNRSSLELDDIITILLNNKKKMGGIQHGSHVNSGRP
ncbi:ABC transporter ATP-binding protein [Paucisalibacillus sp. EB02]|uniref:ATP-binding cassette domain-containing protein n=1 Tax=Paucisalibacillus sp. EB02 TaxID=1347087 RepID=UPI0004BAF1A0|nr:ABC transporter ATP-binding protein [Paucisalibacillus sp. EB02]